MNDVHELKTLTLEGEEFNSFPDQQAREDILKKLPLPAGTARVGQYLRVQAVDAEGKITGVESADVSQDSGGNVNLSGYVKSVNGNTPDEKGNVVIAVSGGSGGGLTSNVIILLTDVLRHALYPGDYDANATITLLATELAKTGGGSGGSGDSGGDSDIYTITYNLTNTISNVSASTIAAGGVFRAELSAEEGYNLSTVTVTMGGTDVTETAYDNGVISIGAVTGNIVIDAVSQPNTMILVNGEYRYANTSVSGYGVDVTVTNNNTVELSNFDQNSYNSWNFTILDGSQANIINGDAFKTATTKFSLVPEDVVELSVTFEEENIYWQYIDVNLCTAVGTTAMSRLTQVSNVGAAKGNTYNSTFTATESMDITELLFKFRGLANTDVEAAELYMKMVVSLKINGEEVLGA